MKPDIEKLKKCIRLLAESMGFDALPENREDQLINHVLFKQEYDGVIGKEFWFRFEKQLITERELRNVFMAHSSTKIAMYNQRDEPCVGEYKTKGLCHNFEIALFGSIVVPGSVDVLDPWESRNGK